MNRKKNKLPIYDNEEEERKIEHTMKGLKQSVRLFSKSEKMLSAKKKIVHLKSQNTNILKL